MDLQKKIFDFLNSRETIEQYRESSTDFTRSCPLSFPTVATSILHLFKESVEYNLQALLPGLTTRVVTGSAFTQARYKIRPAFFKDLGQWVSDTYRASEKKVWKGHVLLAGDGSTLNLPSSKDIKEYFGIHSTNDKGINRYLGRVFFLYDVLNDFVVESRLSKMECGEKVLLRDCLPSLGRDREIIILDRAFGNFCTLKELPGGNLSFCVRLGLNNSNFAKRALKDKRTDFITVWDPSPREQESCRKHGLDTEPMRVRVVKIPLKTGEIELLVTSLCDQATYTTEELDQLYQLRWGVEEGFKNLKPKMKLEHFGCKKTRGVFQEFYAHIFYINMVSLIGLAADDAIQQKTAHRKWPYKYNWKNAYRFLRAKMINILLLEEIGDVLDELIASLSACLVAVKPDRQFVRDTRYLNKKGRITPFHK